VLLETSEPHHPSPQSFFYDRAELPDGPTTSAPKQRDQADALPLAAGAARAALESADVGPSRVTHLVTVSCTGFAAPGVDVGLIGELRLPLSTQRTHIGFMGCHGALNGMRAANAFLTADPAACVLLCAVELCSLHHQYRWRPEQILANALFADGAAAVVGVGDSKRPRDGWRVASSASMIVPETHETMAWQIGDHGFEMHLSPEVPEIIEKNLRSWLGEWLRGEGHALDTIASWAVHPGGPKILQATAKAAGLDPSQLADSEAILAECGNMSSPTILMILDRLRRRSAPRPCVALAFGPGLTVEAALLV
jgi:predicted naringenin-chalcone synthase